MIFLLCVKRCLAESHLDQISETMQCENTSTPTHPHTHCIILKFAALPSTELFGKCVHIVTLNLHSSTSASEAGGAVTLINITVLLTLPF